MAGGAGQSARGLAAQAARLPYRAWLLVAFGVLFPVSWIGAASAIDLMLQHTPTVVFVAVLVATGIRRPLSDRAYTLFFAFLLLHLVGARYLYSNVPYDDWGEALVGVRPGEALGFARNHYDRLVHLLFGVLLVAPAREIMQRLVDVRGVRAWVFAIGLLMIFSTIYELLEWMVAMIMAPETADRYNGQQGDMWDAHRDMALALAGSVIGALAIGWLTRRKEDGRAATD